ncbi:HIT family protein [Stenotrophomonas sp. CFBP 13718]|uniref:HIT family protein n=1 Tax=Stenotrophomonas sp. CFBP 13718 TaxID=2775304 RepID=UPI00177CD1CB|nr:HIT family protein [Stenotrophomonas sp. CFBP 13718]MBD8695876.1 HIT family protein [Stenotrophomonas sp. CFBP 13718]
MPACVVFAITSGSLEANVILQNEHIICFLDHMPINAGHILLCPRQHHADITDLPDDLLTELFLVAKRLASTLERTLQCDGVSLLQNNGAFNDLGHFHLHLFPRVRRDGFAWVGGNNRVANPDALARVRDVLRSAVG